MRREDSTLKPAIVLSTAAGFLYLTEARSNDWHTYGKKTAGNCLEY